MCRSVPFESPVGTAVTMEEVTSAPSAMVIQLENILVLVLLLDSLERGLDRHTCAPLLYQQPLTTLHILAILSMAGDA